MSGARRKGKFRKGVEDSYLTAELEPEEGDSVAQVLRARGANIFEIALTADEMSAKASENLALLPNKYRNVIWVKTKDFLIVSGGASELEEEEDSSGIPAGSKVQYAVKHILNKAQIKHIKKIGKWPDCFTIDMGTRGGRAATSYADDYIGIDDGGDGGLEQEGEKEDDGSTQIV
jgi:hypothetical protein